MVEEEGARHDHRDAQEQPEQPALHLQHHMGVGLSVKGPGCMVSNPACRAVECLGFRVQGGGCGV